VLRRLFDRAFRRARAAEAAGDYRRAAALYAEADLPEEAANALLFHATRVRTLDERLLAYHDALRWLPAGHPRRSEVEARIGLAVLEEAQRRGARGAEEKRRLADAAERLERAGRCSDAATAWELLDRRDDVARCLEKAGEVERLEQLLDRTNAEESRERTLARLVRDHEMAMQHGARLEARAALREAVRVAPDDTAVANLLRHFEDRILPPLALRLDVDGRRVCFVGRLPAALGRDADVVVRGASVSRRHAEVALEAGRLVVRDLDSRNGTLVRGVPIAGEVELSGETEIGLGDDVTIRATPAAERACFLEVEGGLDRGLRVVLGEGALRLPGLPCTVTFTEGHATLAADAGTPLVLGAQPVALPVILLARDRLTLGSHLLEVP
jgi:tetratricopeptide (TPR) repeat protein